MEIPPCDGTTPDPYAVLLARLICRYLHSWPRSAGWRRGCWRQERHRHLGHLATLERHLQRTGGTVRYGGAVMFLGTDAKLHILVDLK